MQRVLVATLVPIVIILSQSASHAVWSFANTGCWPKSWPTQLEEFRSQSRSLYHETAMAYEIPFTKRAQFEAAWPHIVSLASNGAPVTLVQRKGVGSNAEAEAGVRITTPNTGQIIVPGAKETRVYAPGIFDSGVASNIRGKKLGVSAGTYLTVGPPWPDEIENSTGEPPRFVVADGLKWRPTTVQELRESRKVRAIVRRSRTEITLYVDGEIVDLNRIKLPAIVIDKRFEEEGGGQ